MARVLDDHPGLKHFLVATKMILPAIQGGYSPRSYIYPIAFHIAFSHH